MLVRFVCGIWGWLLRGCRVCVCFFFCPLVVLTEGEVLRVCSRGVRDVDDVMNVIYDNQKKVWERTEKKETRSVFVILGVSFFFIFHLDFFLTSFLTLTSYLLLLPPIYYPFDFSSCLASIFISIISIIVAGPEKDTK